MTPLSRDSLSQEVRRLRMDLVCQSSVCLSVRGDDALSGCEQVARRIWAWDMVGRPSVRVSLWILPAFRGSIWRCQLRHRIQMKIVSYMRLSISVNNWRWTPVGRGWVLLITALWRWLRQVWTRGERGWLGEIHSGMRRWTIKIRKS